MATKEQTKPIKQIRIRLEEVFLNSLKRKSRDYGVSLSCYINSVLNSTLEKAEIPFEEVINNKPEKKEIKSIIYFTKGEVELLKSYACLNKWSVPKEIRYRVISSLSKKPKLSGEELQAIYTIRSSINVLGVNINRLLKNGQVLSDHNICKELIGLISQLKDKINYLEKCTYSRFKLQEPRSRDGS